MITILLLAASVMAQFDDEAHYEKIEHQCTICGKSIYVVSKVIERRYIDNMPFWGPNEWREDALRQSIPDTLFEVSISINYSEAIITCQSCRGKYQSKFNKIWDIADSLWTLYLNDVVSENLEQKRHYKEQRRINELKALENQIESLKELKEKLK